MVAKIQDGCQKVTKLKVKKLDYKVVIQLHDSIAMASPWDSISYITLHYITLQSCWSNRPRVFHMTWDIDLYLLLRSAIYIPSLAQRLNPVWRFRSKMATQNYNIHLLGRYPEISFLPHQTYSCWSTLASSCLSQSKYQDCYYYF